MTDETGAAAPATEQAQAAPAETEKATPKVESIPNPGVEPAAEASPENAETRAETEQPQADDSEPKRLTRNQRLQRKAARLSTMVAEQAAKIEKLEQSQVKPDSSPKEADFNGDYFAWQRALTKWDTEQAISSALSKIAPERKDADASDVNRQEAAQEFQDRAEELKAGIPDFDQTVEAFAKAGGKFAPHVIEELLESDKGPLLAYQLAKNPKLASALNALSPRDAAREIGRLEASVSLPQPKKQTQAPAPLTAIKGGAAPTTDLNSLAKSDDASAYIAARRAQRKASA